MQINNLMKTEEFGGSQHLQQRTGNARYSQFIDESKYKDLAYQNSAFNESLFKKGSKMTQDAYKRFQTQMSAF